MPYVSDAQRKFFNANRDKLEKEGVNVDEWNEKSKGKELPEHVGKKDKRKFTVKRDKGKVTINRK